MLEAEYEDFDFLDGIDGKELEIVTQEEEISKQPQLFKEFSEEKHKIKEVFDENHKYLMKKIK